jgi:hypothetical protein
VQPSVSVRLVTVDGVALTGVALTGAMTPALVADIARWVRVATLRRTADPV